MLAPLCALVLAATAPADDAAVALALGDARHAAFDYAGAREAYERAVALAPEHLLARARLAHVLGDLGDASPSGRALFEEALVLAEALRRDAPELAEGHHARAASLARLLPFRSGPQKVRLSREIEASARRAAELDPCLAAAYTTLAITYRELSGLSGLVRGLAGAALGGLPKGTLEDADGLLRAAIALDPLDPFAHYQRALTLERLSRPEEAARELEAVLLLPVREARDLRNREDAEARLSRLRTRRPDAPTLSPRPETSP